MTPEGLLDVLLTKRGFTDEQDRVRFLNPQYDQQYDPYRIHDMHEAVERIVAAMQSRELICIYSDYDADGIPGAVILHDFFNKIGYELFWNYIPHRHTEGYGLHISALDKIHEKNTQLVITVDLGITAVAEVAYAQQLGINVIITDHHEPLAVVPDAVAVVNPKIPHAVTGAYPDTMLCGAGVAFKLVRALIQHPYISDQLSKRNAPTGWEKWLLDMAGIATLSDMVPLVNENRIFAYYGMKVLEKTPRPGLRALFQKAGISLTHLSEDDIVFSVTPRLNAASRMAHPDDAFKLLAAKDTHVGMVAAEHLSTLNDDRKKTVAHIMKEVHARVAKRKLNGGLPAVLVMGDPSWPAGILGLVASKITEEYVVTTFVWGSEGEGETAVKGSCRGIGDVAVVELMEHSKEFLMQFGGHEDAGGFTTIKEHVHFLEGVLNKHYPALKKEQIKDNSIHYDTEGTLDMLTMKHYREMRKMAPFGMANPKPRFAFTALTVVSVKQFGKTKEHLELILSDSVRQARAISWYAHAESFSRKLETGIVVTLIAEFDYSVFRGKEELRLKIVDVL